VVSRVGRFEAAFLGEAQPAVKSSTATTATAPRAAEWFIDRVRTTRSWARLLNADWESGAEMVQGR
jgi:hypothetical protein